jgi:hypothetical protein
VTRSQLGRLVPAVLTALLPAADLAADEESLRRHVDVLASGELEGRLTGTEGERRAAEYLAEQLERLGVAPLPGRAGLLLPFDFTAGSRDVGSSIRVFDTDEARAAGAGAVREWSDPSGIQALSFSDSGSVSAPVVFAGYGLVVPESQDFGYDSYATLDVEDKVVLVLRYFPEDLDQEARATLARYSGLRYKALAARERGARAVIVATGPRSPNAGETIPMTFDTALSGSGIVAASIGGEVARALFAVAGRDLEAVQKELDTGNPHVTGFDLAGIEVTLDVQLERERRTGYNVAGALPGALDNTVEATEAEEEWIVVGAHYDHLGLGLNGNSLARKDEAGKIHFGADDNASGVAAVLELVADLRERRLERPVAVAFWSGEELGLLGSADFLKQEVVPPERIGAYLNFDMVGRVRDNKLAVQGTGSSAAWPRLLEQSNVPVGLDLELQGDPYLPTDSASFNLAQVPTLNFFSGSHEDYHRPTDTAAKVNVEDLDRVARLGALVVVRLARLEEPPQFAQVERRPGSGGSRDTLRAFTGTIPDYTTEVEGLRLSGVVEGGPADEAGLEEGDVIVQFGSQTITNIYDYTYALDAVKIDQPVTVVYLRNGERRETTITPRARD